MVEERKTPFEIAAEKEQQRAALRAIRQHKENIQSSASNLVALYLVGLNVTQKEIDRLYQPLIAYMDANPQVRAELLSIRQPSRDFRNRCG